MCTRFIRMTLVLFMMLCVVLCAPPLLAQEGVLSQETLDHYNAQRAAVNTQGMIVLMSWSGANMATGLAGWRLARTKKWKSFHQMNAMWNVINMGIGVAGYLGSGKDAATGQNLYDSLTGGFGMDRLFALNAGLDLGYIMLGAYLWERGRRLDDDRWRGYGQSVIVQGAFLMGFDAIWMWRQKSLHEGLILQIQQSTEGTLMPGVSMLF